MMLLIVVAERCHCPRLTARPIRLYHSGCWQDVGTNYKRSLIRYYDSSMSLEREHFTLSTRTRVGCPFSVRVLPAIIRYCASEANASIDPTWRLSCVIPPLLLKLTIVIWIC